MLQHMKDVGRLGRSESRSDNICHFSAMPEWTKTSEGPDRQLAGAFFSETCSDLRLRWAYIPMPNRPRQSLRRHCASSCRLAVANVQLVSSQVGPSQVSRAVKPPNQFDPPQPPHMQRFLETCFEGCPVIDRA